MSERRLAELARFYGRTLEDIQELFTERAGIREHDSGMSRVEAEEAAIADLRAMLAEARLGPRRAGSVAESDAKRKT